MTGNKNTMFSPAQFLFISAACGVVTSEHRWIRFPGGLIVKAKNMSYADLALPVKALWTSG